MRNMLLMSLSDKISSKDRYILKLMLDNASDKAVSDLNLMKDNIGLKSSWIGLILGILFGSIGVDRFYKGDLVHGIAKFIILALNLKLMAQINRFPSEQEILIFTILSWVCIIWAVADWFLVFFGIKHDNLEKIKEFLTFHEPQNPSSNHSELKPREFKQENTQISESDTKSNEYKDTGANI